MLRISATILFYPRSEKKSGLQSNRVVSVYHRNIYQSDFSSELCLHSFPEEKEEAQKGEKE